MSIPTRHPYSFDPTYGMTREALLAITPPEAPPGFDVFWENRYLRALTVDPAPVVTASAMADPRWRVFDLRYTSTDGFPIGGWLLLPKTSTVRRGLVVGHGYGGREAPDLDLPVTETAVLFPCFRGISRSARLPISPDPAWHVLDHIESAGDYIIGGCVEDLWVAISALTALYPALENRIGYSGISFGGGIGALAMAFDRRIARGHLIVPTFGHRPLWLTLPTIGSAHAVQLYGKTHADVLETLRFFDAATAATRIEAPMLMVPALFDPAVAPPCQFAIANALPRTKFNEIFILDAGHFAYSGQDIQDAVHHEKIGRFFNSS